MMDGLPRPIVDRDPNLLGIRKQQVLGSNPSVGSSEHPPEAGRSVGFWISGSVAHAGDEAHVVFRAHVGADREYAKGILTSVGS